MSAQALTIGPEVAGHFAEALTLLCHREAKPIDAASLVGADLERLKRLMEVHTLIHTQLSGSHGHGADCLTPRHETRN